MLIEAVTRGLLAAGTVYIHWCLAQLIPGLCEIGWSVSPFLLENRVLPLGKAAFVLIMVKHGGFYIKISATPLFRLLAA